LELFTAFVIGFLGSLHCIGMCGPILLALPAVKLKDKKFILGRIFYNSGRVITYSFLGLMFGLLGKGFEMWGFQRYISISIGIIILIYIFLPTNYKKYFLGFSPVVLLNNKLKLMFGKLFNKKSLISMLLIGIVNGLLPCGFVYMAIGGSVTTGDAFKGMLFMALFGLGTVPLMFTSSVLINFINQNLRNKLKRLIPYLAILLALIFILRGLNLGIPYISPKNKLIMKN
jgi:hypothetical protein